MVYNICLFLFCKDLEKGIQYRKIQYKKENEDIKINNGAKNDWSLNIKETISNCAAILRVFETYLFSDICFKAVLFPGFLMASISFV